jgi:hypothetical protein
MTIATARPTIANPDIAASQLVSRAWDADAVAEFIVATIPSRSEPTRRHTLRGHSHGRDAVCSCWGYQRWGKCAHVAAFVLIIEELERQHYANPRHTTARLLELARWYDSVSDVLNADQRLRYHGVKAALRDRGVRFESTRTLAEQRAVAERAAGAKAILFSEG